MTEPVPAWQSRALLATCALMLAGILYMEWRSDQKMERLIGEQAKVMDYGRFAGEWVSDRRSMQRQMDGLQSQLAVHDAWKISLKGNLSELIALTTDERMRAALVRMKEESEP